MLRWGLPILLLTLAPAAPAFALPLRADARLTVQAPKTVYAGYPFILKVTATGVADSTSLAVLRSGGTTVGAATVTSGRAEPTVTLFGTTKLSAEITIGAKTVLSPAVSVKVLTPRTWRTKASDDGAYTGTHSARFTIAKRGRELRSLRVHVPLRCPTGKTKVGVARVKQVRLAPNGSFVGVARPEEATSIRVRGAVRAKQLTGGVAELSVGTCSGSAAFTAKQG